MASRPLYGAVMAERNPEREAQRARRAREEALARDAVAAATEQPEPPPAAPQVQPRPVEVRSLGAEPPPRTDPTYAWTIAALPIVWIPLAYFAPAIAVSPFVLFGYWVLAYILAVLDSRQLHRAGIEVAPRLVVLIPWYLIRRTTRARSTPAIPIVWFAAAAASLLAQFTFAAVVQVDGDVLEPEIKKWATDQGAAVASIDCPTTWAHEGDTITCSVTLDDGSLAPVDVELGDNGYYTWNWR